VSLTVRRTSSNQNRSVGEVSLLKVFSRVCAVHHQSGLNLWSGLRYRRFMLCGEASKPANEASGYLDLRCMQIRAEDGTHLMQIFVIDPTRLPVDVFDDKVSQLTILIRHFGVGAKSQQDLVALIAQLDRIVAGVHDVGKTLSAYLKDLDGG
jgi:hypothetical protein